MWNPASFTNNFLDYRRIETLTKNKIDFTLNLKENKLRCTVLFLQNKEQIGH